MKAFVARVGGMLAAPRTTVAASLAGEGGGLNDLLLLVVLQVLALRLPTLIRSFYFAVDVGVAAGLMLLANIFVRALLIPAIAAFVGGLLLTAVTKRALFGPRQDAKAAASASGESKSGRTSGTVDIAALCTIPGVCLQLLAAGVQVVWGPVVGPNLILFVGAGWLAILLAFAAHQIREDGKSSNENSPD